MKNKFTIQIRRYKHDGKFCRTIEVGHETPKVVGETIRAWLADHSFRELENNLQTTPLNIMVRRDGKLISYKELV